MSDTTEAKTCTICPHTSDCSAAGSCLEDVNAQYLIRLRQRFSRLMTPEQTNRFTTLLTEGWTLRRLHNAGPDGPAVVTAVKLRNHRAAYPKWGAEVGRMAAANAKAADSLKGVGSSRADKTHCRKGHPYEQYGFYRPYSGTKGTVDRLFRCCKACQGINARKGAKLSVPIVEKVKQLLRAGNSLSSFTNKHKSNGFVCSFVSVKRLCREDPSLQSLAELNQQRRKVVRPVPLLTAPQPAFTKTSNLRTSVLSGVVAGRADIAFSAISTAVFPRHIRDDVMGQLFLDVEEGRVALSDVTRFARKYISAIYEEGRHRISLDEPAFCDGTGGSRLDRLSESDGIWA